MILVVSPSHSFTLFVCPSLLFFSLKYRSSWTFQLLGVSVSSAEKLGIKHKGERKKVSCLFNTNSVAHCNLTGLMTLLEGGMWKFGIVSAILLAPLRTFIDWG